jgi:hypothetical protein
MKKLLFADADALIGQVIDALPDLIEPARRHRFNEKAVL